MEHKLTKQNLLTEDWKKKINQYVMELNRKRQQEIMTMYEKRFMFLPQLVAHLKEKGSIDGEHLHYFPDQYPFSSDDFQSFFDLCTDYLGEEYGFGVDEGCFFENKSYFLRYEDLVLEFFVMWGQGTCTILKLVGQKEEIPASYIGSYQGWITFIENKYEEAIRKKEDDILANDHIEKEKEE